MRRLNIFILTINLLQSCNSGDEEQLVTIGNKNSISIFGFLIKVNNLNDHASLQYQHAWKKFYVIVIDEPKDEMRKALEEINLTKIYKNDINGYSKLILDIFKEGNKYSNKPKPIITVVNQMPTRITSLKELKIIENV